MAFPQKNYTLGRGELYFGRYYPGTRIAMPQMYIGNTTEITLTTETDTLDHYDSDHGIRVKDDSVLLEKNTTGTFITDHISPQNIALMLLGGDGTVTQAAASAQTATLDPVQKGRRYQLGVTPQNPIGVRGISNVSVQASPGGGSSVTLVADVDYKVDADTGSILFLTSGLVLTDDPDDSVVVTYNVVATSYLQIVSGAEGQVEGELFYRSYNPKGMAFDYLWPFVQIRPDGDFNLKGDEWQAINFAFEALKRDDETAVTYVNGRPGQGVDPVTT